MLTHAYEKENVRVFDASRARLREVNILYILTLLDLGKRLLNQLWTKPPPDPLRQECCATKYWDSSLQCAALAPPDAHSDSKQPPRFDEALGHWFCRNHREVMSDRIIHSSQSVSKARSEFRKHFPRDARHRLIGGSTARLRGETGRRIWAQVTMECLRVKRRRVDVAAVPYPVLPGGPESADCICQNMYMESPYDEDDKVSDIIEKGLVKLVAQMQESRGGAPDGY